MSTRKFESSYSKIQKKRRIEALIALQNGAMNKFIKIEKKSELQHTWCTLNEQDNKNIDIVERNNREREAVSDEDNYDSQTHDNEEEIERLDNDSTHLKNIYDPSQWKNIDTNLRDLLEEKCPIKITNIDFPKDIHSRHFSSSNYIQTFPNGEKYERRWLIYSRDLDRVFCFYCKLFNVVSHTSKLANEGSNDWRNISNKLKRHEISNEHITKMNEWIDLEMRLEKKIKQ